MTDFFRAFSKADFPRFFRGVVLSMAGAALLMNLTASWKAYRNEPLREAASRSLMAEESSFFYASGLAEPVPVAALKLAMAAGAEPDKAVRLEGLAVFAVLAALTFFVLRARFGEAAAAMAVLFLSANPYMGYYAMQGSSHLYALVFLLLFWHYFDAPEHSAADALLAGLSGGLACLCRADAALALLVLAAASWALKRRAFGLKRAGQALGLALLLALPYAVYQKTHYGSGFYAQELSLRRWATIDRYGYRPPGYSGLWPSEDGRTPAPAGPLGAAAFVLRAGPAGALREAAAGLGRALLHELPRILYYKFLLVLVFLGLYAAAALGKERLLFFLAAGLLPVLPLASINQVPAAGGIELRYYLWSLWALCALAGLGFQETLAWVETGIKEWVAGRIEPLVKAGGKSKRKVSR